jgi:hypothetical protein
MATNPAYYLGDSARRGSAGTGLPVISEGLDSVRVYQFEVHFELPPDLTDTGQDKLTLACKQITAAGFSTEPIEVMRVNDKVYYPGRASPEEVTATFDNLYQPQVAAQLWRWFKSIYNPVTGKFNENGGNFKANKMIITALDAQGQPLQETRMFGVYPISWKTAEFNYGTNEFHTIEVIFRYDFMEHDDADTAIPSTA